MPGFCAGVGDKEKALEDAEPAAIGLREVKGAEDPRAMFAAYNYGACLYELGRYKEAADVFEPLLAVRYRVLGPTHIDSLYTALALGRLSSTGRRHSQGRWQFWKRCMRI